MVNNSVCIFAESGEYVKFHNMLSITMASVANDMEVNIFFSYSALEKLKKEKINEMSFENIELKNKFNNAINLNKIQNIEQMIKTLKETGLVKFYVCSASLNIMNIDENDLFVVDGIMGLSTFLNKAEKASIVLYI
jgi:peroxiredoxin family protein|tara:strand:- start:1407 stop:1814 length:408 start_codon:yes stop_codon:yes gene_type:complete